VATLLTVLIDCVYNLVGYPPAYSSMVADALNTVRQATMQTQMEIVSRKTTAMLVHLPKIQPPAV
jgi:hypothetical protein